MPDFIVDENGFWDDKFFEQSSIPPVATKVQPPEEDGKRNLPSCRSFSAKATVVQVLPTPLSFKPLNLEDDILVDVENLDWLVGAAPEEASGKVGMITLREREDEEESKGSPKREIGCIY